MHTVNITCRLIYVSPNQINALIPAQQPGWAGQHELSINSDPGALINVVTPPTAASLFWFPDANSTIAALHADYTLISASNPAVPGEYIMLYGTGLAGEPSYGHTNPSSPDELAISIGKITFLGQAPGYDGLDHAKRSR